MAKTDGSEWGVSDEQVERAVENTRKVLIEKKGARPLSMIVPELPWKKHEEESDG